MSGPRFPSLRRRPLALREDCRSLRLRRQTDFATNVLIDGREFRLIMGSDLDRDGMFLELEEVGGEGAPLAYVFFSDGDGSFALTVYDDAAPPAAIAWLESEARRLLPLKPDAV